MGGWVSNADLSLMIAVDKSEDERLFLQSLGLQPTP
jgi:hypothetical protein